MNPGLTGGGWRDLAQQTARQQVQDFQERTAGKIRGLLCPIHGQPPRLRFEGSNLRDMNIQMSACCEELMELANRRIAGF